MIPLLFDAIIAAAKLLQRRLSGSQTARFRATPPEPVVDVPVPPGPSQCKPAPAGHLTEQLRRERDEAVADAAERWNTVERQAENFTHAKAVGDCTIRRLTAERDEAIAKRESVRAYSADLELQLDKALAERDEARAERDLLLDRINRIDID